MGVQVPEIFISDEKAINNEPLLVAEVVVDAKQLGSRSAIGTWQRRNSIALTEFMLLNGSAVDRRIGTPSILFSRQT
jgi:hypothetical protein